jgi:hypothetical protein
MHVSVKSHFESFIARCYNYSTHALPCVLSTKSCMVYIVILQVQMSLFLGFTVTKEMLTLLQTKIEACIGCTVVLCVFQADQTFRLILFVVPAVFENTFECLEHIFLWLILMPCLVARFIKSRCDLILMSTPYVTCPIFVTIKAYVSHIIAFCMSKLEVWAVVLHSIKLYIIDFYSHMAMFIFPMTYIRQTVQELNIW